MRAQLVLIAALLAAPAGVDAAPAVRQITMDKMAFGPPPAGLRVGDTVEWVNADMFQHTATARDGGFDVVIKPKQRARIVLRKAGVVQVYCRYHPGMMLTLKVSP